jgi:hypothetical protein
MFRCGILKRPLERMVVGGLFTASAFFISGFLGTVSPFLLDILTFQLLPPPSRKSEIRVDTVYIYRAPDDEFVSKGKEKTI